MMQILDVKKPCRTPTLDPTGQQNPEAFQRRWESGEFFRAMGVEGC